MNSVSIKIFSALVTLLYALVGLLLYQNYKISMEITRLSASGSVPQSVAAMGGDVTIGHNRVVSYVDGTLLAISATQLTVKDNTSGTAKSVAISTNTPVKLEKAQKDIETLQKELAAFNQQVQELLKDPIKNKAALAALEQPKPRVIVDGSFADLKVGDTVYVELSEGASAPTATTIYKDTLATASGAAH